MKIVALVLIAHSARTNFIRLVEDVNKILVETRRTIERYSESSSANMMGDDPILQLGHRDLPCTAVSGRSGLLLASGR
jgi:hypothetical protein